MSEIYAGVISDEDRIARELKKLVENADRYGFSMPLNACALLDAPFDPDVADIESERLSRYFKWWKGYERFRSDQMSDDEISKGRAMRAYVSSNFKHSEAAVAEKAILEIAVTFNITLRAARWLVHRTLAAQYASDSQEIGENEAHDGEEDESVRFSSEPPSSLFTSKRTPDTSPVDFFNSLNPTELQCLGLFLCHYEAGNMSDYELSDVTFLTSLASEHVSGVALVKFGMKLREWMYHGSLEALQDLYCNYEKSDTETGRIFLTDGFSQDTAANY